MPKMRKIAPCGRLTPKITNFLKIEQNHDSRLDGLKSSHYIYYVYIPINLSPRVEIGHLRILKQWLILPVG